MDAATYSVSYQFKILTTAFFAVVILKKELSLTKWISLCILTGGIALVQLSGLRSVSSTDAESPLVGLVYVALACFLSGLAGIW